MVEFFQLIAAKPLEFLAGLGISSATIYSVIRIIKLIISLIAKKKNIAKEELKFEKLANLVIEKLGGVETFIDNVATHVIDKVTPYINEIKELLTKLANSEKCPVELKAYIETVLNAAGNQELLLAYQELKNQLTNQVIESVKDTIANGEENLKNEKEQEKVEPPTPTVEIERIEIQPTKKNSKTKKKSNTEDTDITYA